MKKVFFLVLAMLAVSAGMAQPVLAQTETPPAGPMGKVTGMVINQNTGMTVTGEMDVMLHILEQNYAEAGMLHGKSQADGTFLFINVPFDANLQFAVMAIYDGVTYFSETAPADMSSLQAAIDVPVYESTSDLANVKVDQMHVVFNIAEDGLEIKEIYTFPNYSGERTVKNVYELGKDQFATLEFPLPADADYIFFKPEDKDRFVKFSGGFADTYPILPGAESSQIMVSYLVPYSGKSVYTYTAPLNIFRINLLVPDQAGISLKGSGLTGPESVTMQNGGAYLVYSYSDLKAGETISLSIGGKAANVSNNEKFNIPFAAFLGFVAIGTGIWWWRRPNQADEETSNQPDAEMDFDQTISEIARLDESREKGDIDEEEYHESREILRRKAKSLLEQDNKEE